MSNKIQAELSLNPTIKEAVYGFSEGHRFLNEEFQVGKNGENTTIMILSLNRAELTIKLMDSVEKHIPDFYGRMLIVDNASIEEEKHKIKKHIKKLKYSCEILELDKNYGVSGGRNRGIKHVKTPWVMSLDNDIYFIGNPIKSINEVASKTGSHFINLPLLDKDTNKIFANGGHLYIHKDEKGVHISAGSMYTQDYCVPNKPFDFSLGTFLYGGASIFYKESFLNIGDFDEEMFIGFEDTDFSIAAFKKGYKIANCGIASLVHDHPKPKADEDIDYEAMRFSREIIEKSAKYFEKKHNLLLWNDGVENWLNERNKMIKGKARIIKSRDDKPRIALVIDVRNWAFENIANQMIKGLKDTYDFTKIYAEDFKMHSEIVFSLQEYDLVHFFWRPQIAMMVNGENKVYIEEELSGSFALYLEDLYNPLNISTCVYDHLLRKNPEERILGEKSLNRADNYYVSSKKLMDIYNKDKKVKSPVTVIQDGVDTSFFKMKNQERFNFHKKRTIRVGWVGNSNWEWEDKDLKGINTIIKPSISLLKILGYDIEIDIVDRNINPRSYEEMPEFYNNIDIYLCGSLHEGTPNPVLEAMSCGVPVISTDVGIVPEVFGEKQKQFIVKERNSDAFAEAIKKLLDNPEKFMELSKENIQSTRSWDWKDIVKKFHEYFEKCLNS